MTVSIEVTQSFLRLNQVLGISVSERINLCTYKQPVSDVIFYTAGQCAADVEASPTDLPRLYSSSVNETLRP